METESENSNFSFPMGQNRANDHSNPYIESTTVLSDTFTPSFVSIEALIGAHYV